MHRIMLVLALISLAAAPAVQAAAIVGGFNWSGSTPYGIGYANGTLWIIDSSSSVIEVDVTGVPTGNSFPDPAGTDPNDLNWADGTWWLTDWEDFTRYVYNVSPTGQVLSSFPGPEGEGMIGVADDGANLWLSSFFTDKIYQVTTGGVVLASFVMPADTDVAGIAYDSDSPGGPFIWAATQAGSSGTHDMIYQLTPAGSVVSSFLSPTDELNDVFGLDWDGSTLWLVCQTTQHIFQIDPFGSAGPTPTPTPTQSPTVTPSETPTVSPTPTGTPVEIAIDLLMPDTAFSEGESCYLDLTVQNPGPEQQVDLYVLLDVLGDFWSYPSWQPLSVGLDHQELTVTEGMNETEHLIPTFTVPVVGPFGPLYFYAAMFDRGYLDLDHLASNGDVWQFSFE